jgi:HK97 gp10 family phage protein
MADRVFARVTGAEATIKALQGMENIVDTKLRAALQEGAEMVAEDARGRAPVGTREPRKGAGVGRLKMSIKAKKVSGRKGAAKLGVRVIADYPNNASTHKSKTKKQAAGGKEYYAFAVEYGTKKMPAQPFMAPAMISKQKQVVAKIQDAMEEACREAQTTV